MIKHQSQSRISASPLSIAAMLLFLLLAPSHVMAAQSAQFTCVEWDWTWDSMNCSQWELHVTISPNPGDIGKPGGFGIGAQLSSGAIAEFTQGGWAGVSGAAMANTVDGYYESIPATKSWRVFRGSMQAMCNMTGGAFSVYAGYGVLDEDKEDMVRRFHAKKNPRLPADHLRTVYIQNSATEEGMGRNGIVFSDNCGWWSF